MTDKFVSPCPPPTEYERELLTILIEEAAEVQQRATKMLRFGVTEVEPGQPDDNAYRLGLEVGDLREVIERCVDAGLIDLSAIARGRVRKTIKLAKFMQTTKE